VDDVRYKIAFFTNTYLPFIGGVSHSVELYAEYLKRLGNRVLIFAPEYDTATEDTEDVRRILSISNFNNTEFSLPFPISSRATADFRGEYFDIVHVHHPFLLGEMGLRYARWDVIPLVFTYHTQYERYTHYVPINDELAERTILNHANEFCNLCDLVIPPTRDVKTQLLARGVESPIVVLPTGIELSKYAHANPARARARLELGDDTPVLLYVGRLAEEKNLDYLFDVAAKVLYGHPRAIFLVAGSGAYEETLKELSDDTRGGRVRFLGTVLGEELRDLYAAADVFIFASTTETQGVVLVEAMAGGTPVIALDAAAVREVVKDGLNGRLLDANATTETFAEVILDFIGDKKAQKELSAGASKTAMAYDMPKLTARLLRHYEELKLIPRHKLKKETISFGLIRNYFSMVWEDISATILNI
jgi:1,2-diacylglycerol 3-alpha-glucosyltransferase